MNTRVLCVLSRLLGNKVLSYRILDVLHKLPNVDVKRVFIDPKDFGDYPSGPIRKRSFALNVAGVARRKVRDTVEGSYDILVINGFEIALGLREEIRRHPTALELDATPRLAHGLLRKSSHSVPARIKSWVSEVVMSASFGRVFRHVDIFLPMTQWCGESLAGDHGIARDRIYPTYCPVDLARWRPADRPRRADEPVTLLFVGNDFLRKGGDELLRIHETCRRDFPVRLRIVSRDRRLTDTELPRDVEVYRDIPLAELIDIYRGADLFVFPTRKEFLGVAAIEACCVGIPVIARDVGGLGEFVIDGHSGYLMPYDSSEDEWAAKIRFVVENPEHRQRMGRNARALAEEMFSLARFERIVRSVIDRLT
jgi:glycosyltransferase involved in cell wall biosynthesis